MAHDEPVATISICSSASTVGFVRKPVPSMRLLKRAFTNTTWKSPGENIMTKDKLLAIGDKYETMISADKAADAKYK